MIKNIINIFRSLTVRFGVLSLFLLQSVINYAQTPLSDYGSFPYEQSFHSTTQPGEISKPATSGSTTNSATFTVDGVRLTQALSGQFGAIFVNDRRFSSASGINIEFEYMSYGGNGADGFTVFFFDESEQNPQIGSYGAAIGYSYNRSLFRHYPNDRRPGLTGAYLGIAFDSYGNCKTTRWLDEEIIGGIGIVAGERSHITLRGARGVAYPLPGMGTGYTGYPVLITQATKVVASDTVSYVLLKEDGNYDFNASSPYTGNFDIRSGAAFDDGEVTNPAYRKAIIDIYPIDQQAGGMYVTIKIQHGETITTVIDKYPYKSVTKYRETGIVSTGLNDSIYGRITGSTTPPLYSSVLDLPSAIPDFLRIGFAAATGQGTDIHMIKNLRITLPGSAEAYDDFDTTSLNTSVTLSPLLNDVAYQGTISENQVGSNEYINPASFKFVLADGSAPDSDYSHQAAEGTWTYNVQTELVTFTPALNFQGDASIEYSIKGGLPGHTEPYADEAYRSLPATITVTVADICPFTNLTNGILYVKDYTHPEIANSTAGDGSTWETAYSDFADALRVAGEYTDCITEIWVAEGTYYPKYNAASGLVDNSRDRAFLIPDGISIYGGFPASAETSSNYDKDDISHRNWSEWETILSGDLGTQGNIADNAYHVIISGSYTENSVLDGLTVTGGNANSEDWITIYTGDMIYRNLGGGIYISNSSVKLYNMRISGNKAYELSGGWSNPAGLGGGLYIIHVNRYPSLINSIVSGNLAYQGAGIYINNLSTASDILFTNITIAGNRAGSGYGGAILSSGSTSSFKNSIIWNNGDSTINYTSSQKLNFINCLVEGSNGSENWNENVGTDGGNNIDKDPLFVGEEDISSAPTLVGNYRLSICSPAIDKGDKTFAELSGINNDLGGLPRIYNDIQIDIGAYEYQGNTCYTLLGTVFPFVYNATPEFDTLFIYRAELHAVPPVGTFDPVADILNGTPLYESKVINYDGTVFVPGTPRNPGPLGSQNNPGLPIEWSFIGKTQGTVDTTSVISGEAPSLPVGLFIFENVNPGDYILMISREGYLTRFAKITVVDSDQVLGHRELLPGDVNGDFLVNSHDVSIVIAKMASYGSNRYGAKYDLNGDGTINQIDISLLIFYQSASIEMYRETLEWILEY